MKPDPAEDTNPVERADLAVADALCDARDHPAMRLAGTLSELADQPPLIALSAAVIAAGLIGRRADVAGTGVRMLAAHLLSTHVKGQLKDRIDRTRPDLYLDHDHYRAEPGRSKEGPLRSFPSGHSAGATAVARAVARRHPAGAAPAYALAALASAVQVPRSTHYLSDVVAGVAIGIASEWGIDRLLASASRPPFPNDREAG